MTAANSRRLAVTGPAAVAGRVFHRDRVLSQTCAAAGGRCRYSWSARPRLQHCLAGGREDRIPPTAWRLGRGTLSS
jgi:hypothetical protein